jgi:hypothetical protein
MKFIVGQHKDYDRLSVLRHARAYAIRAPAEELKLTGHFAT